MVYYVTVTINLLRKWKLIAEVKNGHTSIRYKIITVHHKIKRFDDE